MSNFITALEPHLHTLERDELILLYILMGDFQVYSRATILDINIIDVCDRAKITQERYNGIIDTFEELKFLKRHNKSELQNVEWVEFCLPTLHRKNLKKSHQVKRFKRRENEHS